MTASINAQIVNHDTKQYLHACISSLLATLGQSGRDFQILTLNNGSADDLTDIRASFGESVQVVESQVNLGFGAGHNLLARDGRSELICIVNPDAKAPAGNGLERLLSWFDDPQVAAAGPALMTDAGTVQQWDHGELRGLRARVANGAGHAHWRPRERPERVAWVAGAFMVVRRSAFERAGGFDERFFLYKEDEDLCLRLRAGGGEVVYDPEVRVSHVGGVVAGRDEELMRSSRAYFNEKNFPGRRRRRLLELLYLHVTRRF